MKVLELFSGTGSVGKVAVNFGFNVVSLDRDMDADIKVDIMNWDYKIYPPGHFDIIWASPPCTEYSIAKTIGIRKIEEANEIVKRVLDIISYFEPLYFMIENPQTGLLKNQDFMQGIPYSDVDYCKYGMPYRKRTRIWNNLTGWSPKPLCQKDCDSMNETKTRHKQDAQRSPSGRPEFWGDRIKFKQEELYIIPELLVEDIFGYIFQSLISMSTPHT